MALHYLGLAVAAVGIRYKGQGRPTFAAAPSPFVGGSSATAEMTPLPIEPDWVIAGDPQARYCAHSQAVDKFAATGVWDCTAGTFRWYFGWDETVVILEGEVHIRAEDGSERTLGPGDVGYFRGGTWATWHIDTYVKKIAFVRKPLPMPLSYAFRAWAKFMPKKKAALAA
ncbi:cupin domain-containing protein [Neorhizobium sp. NPDC001467]|uniref:cupin domain-containing protein n=1 Tax=Neorhizobium sp. NPDC001467 TaxID=3390595 RepID=UPI003D06BD4B